MRCRGFLTVLVLVPLVACSACRARPKIVGGDEKETYQLLKECGALALISRGGLAKDSNLIVGKIRLCFESPTRSFRTFRMALMIYTQDGKRIPDFFQGILAGNSPMVGDGNAVVPVPRIWRDLTGGAAERMACRVQSPGRGSWATTDMALVSLAADFPGFVDRDFQLTFREFNSATYFLQNVPRGRAYVWFQTSFDGNRVTQFPIMLKLDAEQGAVNRLDISIEDFRAVFHTL